MNTKDWIDITQPVYEGMVHWPGNVPVALPLSHAKKWGDAANVTTLIFSAHTGTHVDAPCHFISGGADTADLPLDNMIGKTRVIEITDETSIKPGELEQHHIEKGERLLFKTHNSKEDWVRKPFNENYVYLSVEGARYLRDKKILLAGIDYLSLGGGNTETESHLALLENGIIILEGINLSKVKAGYYEMICLPLKIKDSDGAPARVIVRKAF